MRAPSGPNGRPARPLPGQIANGPPKPRATLSRPLSRARLSRRISRAASAKLSRAAISRSRSSRLLGCARAPSGPRIEGALRAQAGRQQAVSCFGLNF